MKNLAYIKRDNLAETSGNFEALRASWLKYIDVRPTTARNYDNAIKYFIEWTHKEEITTPTRDDVIRYRDFLLEEKSAGTAQAYITALKIFFSWVEDMGGGLNIARRVKTPTPNRNQHKKGYLTEEQAAHLIASIDGSTLKDLRDRAIILLMVTTGVRDIEVSRATIGSMQYIAGKRVLYVHGKGKDDASDFVKLTRLTADAIEDYLTARGDVSESAPLFASLSNNNNGGHMTTRAISGAVNERLKRAGLYSATITAHSLRHTAATIALRNGAELMEVKQLLRHANVNTTLIYVHELEREKNRSEEIIAEAIAGATA
jgi:integrase/recombinase XerC